MKARPVVFVVQHVLALSLLGLALVAIEHPAPPERSAGYCEQRLGPVLEPAPVESCVHQDVAPPGVDPSRDVTTAELRGRPGAGAAAHEAAEDLGVPATTVATTASSPDVPCDGDGTSGYRIQAMYVVEASRANRYAALLPNLRLWAAGTDDVVNRSAALTGGVRHLRYVTEAGGGGCVAKVLNVTVPDGSASSFSATISAVQALGYTAPTRKYLMWVDASVLCGVANMYLTDSDTQANANNGSYPQYARVDSGCWGWGDGANQHSVEAHETLHMLGGVQDSAPHSTRAGHCYDEADTMCYADGGGYPMQQVCPAGTEYFFDCNHDDYFSTYPDPGGYLDTHWNSADSRFLVGGGDGAGGGTTGTPTVLGATIAVNNPGIPGLPTQVSVTPAVPGGRTLTGVLWRAGRADCAFSAPAAVQSEVTCSATSATATTVSVTVTDSSGATRTVSSPLTFSTSGPRQVGVALRADGQAGTASVCSGAAFPLRATVLDVASGRPVKGLTVAFTRRTATMTAPAAAGSAATSVAGEAGVAATTTLTTAYGARTTGTTLYPAVAATGVTATPTRCATALTAAADDTDLYYGDPVVLTGRLTRSAAGATVPVGGVTLAVRLTTASGTATLASVRTLADGTYRAVVKPTASGTLSVVLPASTTWVGSTAGAGAVTVRIPATALSATAAPLDVGYGNPVTVTGQLNRVAGSSTTPLAGTTVSVLVTAPGRTPVTVASGRTTTSGAFTVPVALRLSGAMSVRYAGTAGQPAATVGVGTVVAGTWTTGLTSRASASAAPYGTVVTISGTLSKTYRGVTTGAKGLTVRVLFRATGSTTSSQVASGVTTTTGSYSIRLPVRASGTWTAVLNAQAGYTAASAPALPITMTAPAG